MVNALELSSVILFSMHMHSLTPVHGNTCSIEQGYTYVIGFHLKITCSVDVAIYNLVAFTCNVSTKM